MQITMSSDGGGERMVFTMMRVDWRRRQHGVRVRAAHGRRRRHVERHDRDVEGRDRTGRVVFEGGTSRSNTAPCA